MNTVIIVIAQYAIILVPILVVVAYRTIQTSIRKQFLVILVIGCIIGYVLLRLASSAYYDPRPFTNPSIIPLFPHSADNGFPSDHTTSSALAAFIVFAFSRKIGSIMIVLALAVGTARVLAHVHSWMDIIGAVIVALGAATLAYFACQMIIKKQANNNKMQVGKETS